MRRTYRAALLAATLLASAGGGLAFAQAVTPAPTAPAPARAPAPANQGSVYDPAQLPLIQGKVAQYDLTPRGDVDGLILDDGTEVHFPPHLGTQVVAAVRPGDSVTIHGLKARALKLVQAMSVANDAASGTVIDLSAGPGSMGGPMGGPKGDHGPRGMANWRERLGFGAEHGPEHGPGRGPDHSHGPGMGGQQIEAQGTVKMALHGPRGELNGVLLTDGTMVHLPPPEAARLGDQLQPGASLAARGRGVANNLGKSLAAFEVGPSADKLVRVAPPPHGRPGPTPPAGGQQPPAPQPN